ncbi:hypothetical protein EU803_09025 [Loktanella sp. IMCC34160]|uniref:hypothetical protein n=1 Tax=Loktanella sp. IMCC34160 TaxID=2510646 RepID=UPI00101B5F43|nr:hypothetical protein [Loktanella sp. IMCC34160]RYG91231.1 hypothetical protein EU803_09025 [Loktanella sp. IMCC34160]
MPLRPAISAIAALLVLTSGLPVAAQEPGPQAFQLPEGCEGFVTVQKRDCSVSNHFICDFDPQGHQRRADFDERGMTYVGRIDEETRWIESFHVLAGEGERLLQGEVDPASFSALLADGVDTYDFRTETERSGIYHFVGQDRLTGRQVTIDGVTLDETEYQIAAFSAEGVELWRSAGNEFIHRDWRMFLSGTSTLVTSEGAFDTDDTPVEFIFPGEPGFMSINPKHGCGAMLSSLPRSFMKETANDHL